MLIDIARFGALFAAFFSILFKMMVFHPLSGYKALSGWCSSPIAFQAASQRRR